MGDVRTGPRAPGPEESRSCRRTDPVRRQSTAMVEQDQDQQGMSRPADAPIFQIDIECPRCHYNLRGLIKPRCPECGAAFDPQRLVEEMVYRRHRSSLWWIATDAASRPTRGVAVHAVQSVLVCCGVAALERALNAAARRHEPRRAGYCPPTGHSTEYVSWSRTRAGKGVARDGRNRTPAGWATDSADRVQAAPAWALELQVPAPFHGASARSAAIGLCFEHW
jgi:hypothetical protein